MKKVNPIETGRRIKLFMMNRGISSEILAEKLNYSDRTTISRWTRGKSVPSYENLVNMSDILDCKPEELVIFDEE